MTSDNLPPADETSDGDWFPLLLAGLVGMVAGVLLALLITALTGEPFDELTAERDELLEERGRLEELLAAARRRLPGDLESIPPTPPKNEPPEDIDFDRKCWVLAGPYQGSMMGGHVYTCSQWHLRLLDLTHGHPVYKRVLQAEKMRDPRNPDSGWVEHGKHESWMADGSYGYCRYHMGEQDGTRWEWFANGHLMLKQEWLHGREHGVHERWYANGQKAYEIHYSFGVETAGQNWDKDGKPF